MKAELSSSPEVADEDAAWNKHKRYLLFIQPTCVEAERAFSAAGVLCTELRSRSDDCSFNTHY